MLPAVCPGVCSALICSRPKESVSPSLSCTAAVVMPQPSGAAVLAPACSASWPALVMWSACACVSTVHGELQAELPQQREIALDLLVHGVDDQRVPRVYVEQHVRVGAGYGVEQLDRIHDGSCIRVESNDGPRRKERVARAAQAIRGSLSRAPSATCTLSWCQTSERRVVSPGSAGSGHILQGENDSHQAMARHEIGGADIDFPADYQNCTMHSRQR